MIVIIDICCIQTFRPGTPQEKTIKNKYRVANIHEPIGVCISSDKLRLEPRFEYIRNVICVRKWWKEGPVLVLIQKVACRRLVDNRSPTKKNICVKRLRAYLSFLIVAIHIHSYSLLRFPVADEYVERSVTIIWYKIVRIRCEKNMLTIRSDHSRLAST